MVWPQRGLLIWLIPNYKGHVKLSLQTQRQTGVMQAFVHRSLMWAPCTGTPSQLLLREEKRQLVQHSRSREAEKEPQITCIVMSCGFYYLRALTFTW